MLMELSILFVRFDWAGHKITNLGAPSFNSLCEIQRGAYGYNTNMYDDIAFNSLCEIQTNQPFPSLPKEFPFNSLCEILEVDW